MFLFIYSISGNKLDIKDPSAVVTQATGDIKVGKYVWYVHTKLWWSAQNK